jgi:hypothetical protein
MLKVTIPIVFVTSLAACGTAHPTKTATAVLPVFTPSATASPVSPVPGSHANEYQTGPFQITLKGIGLLPASDDDVTPAGKNIPEYCAIVDVENVSNSFTGWVAPSVEFVKGHSLRGQLLDTEAADPDGGSSGGESSPLAPGQSQVLYACPQGIGGKTYVESQLVSVQYGTPGQGSLYAPVIRLGY